MSLFTLPRQFKRMLTWLPRKAYLPYIRKTLRNDYDAADLTPDEALLISGNLAYDKRAASRLLKESGKTAAQLVSENPRRAPKPDKRRRFRRWLMSMEGSVSFEVAHNRLQLPEHRRDIVEYD